MPEKEPPIIFGRFETIHQRCQPSPSISSVVPCDITPAGELHLTHCRFGIFVALVPECYRQGHIAASGL